jgi:hypothetical protein
MAESRPCVRRGVFFGQFGGCQDLGVVCSTASWASEEVKKANQREEAMLAVPSPCASGADGAGAAVQSASLHRSDAGP